ncbi:MAG: non-homologous end-joining DNA ligase [Nibricoccus sp.]
MSFRATTSLGQRSPRSPSFVIPMKALGVSTPPSGTWRCEIKFDGYRALALLDDGAAELWSRNEKNISADYPEIVKALGALKCRSAILDGEIVALDEAGRSRFQLLQAREISAARPPIAYCLFDLVQLDDEDFMSRPIEERRAALEKLLKRPMAPLQLSPVFVIEPAHLMPKIQEQGLEGLIAKRPASLYEPDRRSGAWLKWKVLNEQEFVIGGFTEPRNSRSYFGAILVGYYQRGKLLYAGKVGTGFDFAALQKLHGLFSKIQRDDCPFSNLPMERRPRFGQGMTRAEMRKVTWLDPKFVAQIRFGEWTHDGLLRQPVFLGLRKDKAATEVRREAGAATSVKKQNGRFNSTH